MKRKVLVARLIGITLLLISGVATFAWFIWLVPLKNFYSTSWRHNYSTVRCWEEAQKTISRVGVTHDVGIQMGHFGDKHWVTWIMEHVRPGQEIVGCDASHLAGALADMTNQQLGYQADPWLAWWKTNQNKTQLEWIRQGFIDKGISLQKPLTTNNVLALLKLSRLDTNSTVVVNSPLYLRESLRFNAFRWLRDSGFRAQSLDLNTLPANDREPIIIALIDYAEWFGSHRDDPGKLNLAEPTEYAEPLFMEKQFRWTLYFILGALAATGLWLVSYRPPRSNQSLQKS